MLENVLMILIGCVKGVLVNIRLGLGLSVLCMIGLG